MPDPTGNGQAPTAQHAAPPVAPSLQSPPTSPPPAAPPSSPPATAPSAPQAPSTAPLRDYFASQGIIDASQFQSDDAVLSHLKESRQKLEKLPQLEQHAQYAQRYYEHAPQFEKYLSEQQQAAQQAQQAQQQAAAAPPTYWNPPEYDPAYDRFSEWDPESERFVPLAPELAAYAKARNDYDSYVRSKLIEFRRNPYEFIKPGIEPVIESRVNPLAERVQKIEEWFDEQQSQRVIDGQERLLYQVDAQGNPVADQQGYYQLSPAGQMFEQAFEFSKQFRNGNRAWSKSERFQYALTQAQAFAAQNTAAAAPPLAPATAAATTTAAPPATPAEAAQPNGHPLPHINHPRFLGAPNFAPPAVMPQATGEDHKEAFLQRAIREAAHSPGRSAPGSVAAAATRSVEQPPTRNSFAEMALAIAQEQGLDLSQ